MIHVAALRRLIRIGKFIAIFFDFFLPLGVFVRRRVDVLAENDIRRAFRAHDRDFRLRPRHHHIRAEMPRTHGNIRAAVSFPHDQRHFRDGRFGIGVEQFRAVPNDAAVFLRRAGQIARRVHNRQERNAEGVAEAHEARPFVGCVDVEAARHHVRLIGDDADRMPAQADKADDDILGEMLMRFQKFARVRDLFNHVAHVIGLIRVRGDKLNQGVVNAGGGIVGIHEHRLIEVVLREK